MTADEQAMRGALVTQLLTLGWEDQTAFEGKGFTPTAGVPYQELTTVFSDPDAITLAGSDLQRGLFQVRVLWPVAATDGSGTAQDGIGATTARAKLIKAAFPRNSRLIGAGGQVVKVMRTPGISRGPVQGDRDVTIVRVRFSDR